MFLLRVYIHSWPNVLCVSFYWQGQRCEGTGVCLIYRCVPPECLFWARSPWTKASSQLERRYKSRKVITMTAQEQHVHSKRAEGTEAKSAIDFLLLNFLQCAEWMNDKHNIGLLQWGPINCNACFLSAGFIKSLSMQVVFEFVAAYLSNLCKS